MRRDLRGRSPVCQLFKRQRTENAAIFMFAQEPLASPAQFPLLVRRERWLGARRGRSRAGRRNHNCLPGLQFSTVLDVIKFLQFIHTYFVLFCDRGQRFTAHDRMRVTRSVRCLDGSGSALNWSR